MFETPFVPGTVITSTWLNAVQDALSQLISIQPEGAVGDGLADDTLSVQAAINAAANNVVELAAGKTYLCGPLTIPHQMVFRISGTLKMRDTSGVLLTISGDDVTLYGDGYIDLNNTEDKGVLVTGDRFHAFGLTFQNMLGGAATSGSSSALNIANCAFPRIHDLKFKNIQKGTAPAPFVSQPRAMSFDFVDQLMLVDVLCEDVYAGAALGEVTKSEIGNLTISNPTLTTVDNGLYIIDSTDILFSDVRVKNWNGESIVFSGSNRVTVKGGEILDWTGNAAIGIEDTDNLTVDGMRFRAVAQTNAIKSRPANTSSNGIILTNLQIAVSGFSDDIIAFYNGAVNQLSIVNSTISGAVTATEDFNNRFVTLVDTNWFVIEGNTFILRESGSGVATAADWLINLVATDNSSFKHNTLVNQTVNGRIRIAGGNNTFIAFNNLSTFRDFGAAGDGVTDDTTAITSAINSSANVIDGEGLTYLISSELTGVSNLILENATFTSPALSSTSAIIRFAGTDGTPQTLASNYAEGVFGMTVSNGAAFSESSWAFLTSDEYWADAAADNVRYGELVQISTVVGNVLTFAGSTLLAYTTAANATITPLTTINNVTLRNVNAIGPDSTGNQFGFVFNRCVNVVVEECDLRQFDHTHISIQRSAGVIIRGGSASKTGVQEGLDYGVSVIEGSYNVLVNGFRADRVRHVITIGGSRGVSRFITAQNCHGSNMTDAGMDSHSAVHEHSFINNTLHFADDADVTIDGIVVSGTSPTVSGNQIYNCKRHGIAWIPEAKTTFGGPVSAIISQNIINQQRNTGSTSGILINPTTVTSLKEITSINIEGNQCGGFINHTRIITKGAAIRKVRLAGGQCLSGTRGRAVHIDASSGDIDGLEISGGSYEVDNITTAAVIDFAGTASGSIKNWRIVSPHLKRNGAGTVGIAFAYCTTGSETGTIFEGASVPYTVDANSTGILRLDLRQRSIYTHSVSNSYTVLPYDEYIILNRAATVTLTLPSASVYQGRTLFVKTIQAQAVDSASSNVAPIGDSTAGTSILPATDGAWALLKSDGTNWIVMQRGT